MKSKDDRALVILRAGCSGVGFCRTVNVGKTRGNFTSCVLLNWGYKPEVWDETAAEGQEGELPLDATEPRLATELSSTDNVMAVSADGNGMPDDE